MVKGEAVGRLDLVSTPTTQHRRNAPSNDFKPKCSGLGAHIPFIYPIVIIWAQFVAAKL
jgi:hypothetical protein